MPLQGREIKNRLRSIKNSKKITKAMELVSAAKMRRAVQGALNTRTYANTLWGIINRVRAGITLQPNDAAYRFFTEPKVQRTALILFTSNRGLCGAFNANVMKKVLAQIKEYGREQVEVIAVGKKGVTVLNVLGIKAEFAYVKDDVAKNTGSIAEIATYVTNQYATGKVDKVLVAYTDYQSAVLQTATVKQLFPLVEQDSITAGVGEITDNQVADYIFEPGKLDLLDYVIPRLAEVQLYQALLESNASEHSARMLAMKNATDSASDMIDELALAYNRARQASITKEIAEISAGTAAVS